MVYYGYNGQEIEDAEMANMRRDAHEARQERTLEDYNNTELKDYIRGFYAIPLSRFTGEDRTHLQAATKMLKERGYDVQLRKGHHVVFPKIKQS